VLNGGEDEKINPDRFGMAAGVAWTIPVPGATTSFGSVSNWTKKVEKLKGG